MDQKNFVMDKSKFVMNKNNFVIADVGHRTYMLIPVICTGCPIHLGNALAYHSRNGKPCIISLLIINRGCSFEINGAFVGDNELVLQNVHESPKIETVTFQ